MAASGRRGCPARRAGAARAVAVLVTALAAGAVGAGQMSLETYANLRRGMLESEVLLRAGPPDLVTSPQGDVVVLGEAVYGPDVRELHYMPDGGEHDPQLTVVTITRGRVSALERRKITAPSGSLYGGDAGEASPGPAPRRDIDIRRERVDRTLDAAERYSDVRARIKARSGEAPTPRPQVYQGRDDDGSAYFGDVPPPVPDADPDTGAD